jgi:hypothetical protein
VSLSSGTGRLLEGVHITVADAASAAAGADSQQLRGLSSTPYVDAVMGAAVTVPIPPGQPAPSDPSTTPQVQGVLTSLSPLLGPASPAAGAAAATQATGSFLSAAGTNSSAVTIATSAPAVTYASLPPGTAVAGQQQPANTGAASVSAGVAVGAAVGCIAAVAIIAVVVWLLMKRRGTEGKEKVLAKKQPLESEQQHHGGAAASEFVNPMANQPR